MLPILNRAPADRSRCSGIGNTYLGLTRDGPGVEDGDPERSARPATATTCASCRRTTCRAPPRSSPRARPARGASSPSTTARRTGAVSRGRSPRRPGAPGSRPPGPSRGTRGVAAIAARRADRPHARRTPSSSAAEPEQRARLIRDLRGASGRTSVLSPGRVQPARDRVVEGAGERAEGLTVSLSAAANSALPPRGRAWAAEFTRRYGSRPCCYAVHAAQVTELVLDAIEQLRRHPRRRARASCKHTRTVRRPPRRLQLRRVRRLDAARRLAPPHRGWPHALPAHRRGARRLLARRQDETADRHFTER